MAMEGSDKGRNRLLLVKRTAIHKYTTEDHSVKLTF